MGSSPTPPDAAPVSQSAIDACSKYPVGWEGINLLIKRDAYQGCIEVAKSFKGMVDSKQQVALNAQLRRIGPEALLPIVSALRNNYGQTSVLQFIRILDDDNFRRVDDALNQPGRACLL